MKIKACVLRDMIGLSDVRQLVLESVTEIKMAIDQKSIVYANIEVFKLVNILSRIHMMSNRERDNSVVKVLWTVETSLLVQIAIVMMSYTIFSGLSCYRGFNSLVYNDFV